MQLDEMTFTGEVIDTAGVEAGPDAIRLEMKESEWLPSVGEVFAISGQEYACLSVSKIQWLPFFESFGRVIIARPK